jgi:hypothetical protein
MKFQEKALIRASLYHTHGCGDEGLVILQSVGWEEVLQNVMEIYITPPASESYAEVLATRA